MKSRENLPIFAFESQPAWDAWLEGNHGSSTGIWLKIAKKETGIASVNYNQAVETAISYGWIDGQKAAFDENYWLQKFTPRGSRSIWSQVNCEKAEALIAAGKMHAAGMHQVELAKSDGRWQTAYAPQSKIEIPPDLQSELEKNPAAGTFFNELNSLNRFAILYRLQTAKKSTTRSARLKKFIEMLARGEKIHP